MTDPRVLKSLLTGEMDDDPAARTTLDVEQDLAIPDTETVPTNPDEALGIAPSKTSGDAGGDPPDDTRDDRGR
ncbi:hypothetical protein [Paracoccus luteus]|uniref:hypothetical protein n=1 Tax=Paracoccus luteus TaxID=2508543 RepID=UPI0010702290|nr:hypothetical protein [Paracoccus luteus]